MAAPLRTIGGTFLLVAIMSIALACTTATQPAPASTPVGSSPAVASPAATAETKPAASPDWKVEWDKMVAAAKKEGKVVVAGRTGDSPRQAAMAFEKAYPEIKLEWTGVSGSTFSPRIIQERQAGAYNWDVHLGGAMSMIDFLVPVGALDPLKPALILPEVVDNSKWRGGYDIWWRDAEKRSIIGFEATLASSILVNREFVTESELKNHDQLLEPQWKDKIASIDLSRQGSAGAAGAWFLKTKGEAWFRKFLAQVVVKADERQVVESAVRGTQPVVVQLPPAAFAPFQQQGLTKKFEALDPAAPVAQWLGSGAGHMGLINKAPNPNAAKVFVNWMLSREGQQSYTDATGASSARLDVDGGDPMTRPERNANYPVYDALEMEQFAQRAYAIAKEVLASR